MLRIRIWFNKHLQSGISGYLLIMGIALLLLLCLVCVVTIFDKDFSWNVFYALGFNPVHHNPWLYISLGILGTLVFGGVMVTVFTSGVERNVERLRNGQIRYDGLKNHIIVLGWNYLTTEMIPQLCEKHPHITILLLVQDNASEINTILNSSLPTAARQWVIVYASGTKDPVSLLPTLSLNHAQTVYLNAGDDSNSNEIAQLMQLEQCSPCNKRKHPLPVYVQINNAYTYNLLQRIDTDSMLATTSGKQRLLDIHLYNFHENWARNLWGYGGCNDYEQLDFEPLEDSGKHVHLVIVGFGNMGIALLLEAIRICHYPANISTNISIIDPQASLHAQRFSAQFPNINDIKDINIQFIEGTTESATVRQQICHWADDTTQLLTIAICLRDPDNAFRTAINLPEAVYIQPGPSANTHTRILVRQAVPQFPHTLSLAARYSNIKFFGSQASGFDLNMLSDELPIIINGLYGDNLMGQDSVSDLNPRLENWRKRWSDPNQTSEASKYASRYQADRFRSLISMLRRLDGGNQDALLEELAESEHNRWISERILAGWRQAKKGEHRSNALRIHDNIIPYNQLTESEKQKDRNVIHFALRLTKHNG